MSTTRFLVPLLALLTIPACFAQDGAPAGSAPATEAKTITLTSTDGLAIAADLRAPHPKNAPFVLLCHQAGSSRGEYGPIAPRLVRAGCNCLAIDQRSGRAMNGVENLTAQRAAAKKLPTTYLDARRDIEAALAWVRTQGYDGPLVLWGSSYSSALALVVAAETEVKLAAVLAFAPGEYLGEKGIVGDAAAKLKTPVLIVSPERERAQAEAIFGRIRGGLGVLEIGAGIIHGSRTLYRGADADTTWKTVLEFVAHHVNDGASGEKRPTMSAKTETITLGAGCFWCVEAVLERVDGVLSVESGYMGGHVDDPTYEQVCSSTTGHAEVVQVVFDPDKLPISRLLDWFWKLHDPTSKNRQGADEGPQYRSAIFYHTDAQKAAAEKSLAALEASGAYAHPVVTEITKASKFWKAEGYHQDYFKRNPNQGYCRFVISPKVEKLFEK